MANYIERFGRTGDQECLLPFMPIIGVRRISSSLSGFFIHHKSSLPQLTYIIQGDIDFTLNGRIHNCSSGDILINRPNEVFGTLNQTFPASKTAFLKFDIEELKKYVDESFYLKAKNFFNSLVFNKLKMGDECQRIIEGLLQEHRYPDECSFEHCKALFIEMLVLLIRSHSSEMEEQSLNTGKVSRLIKLVDAYLHENLAKKIHIRDLAEQVELSESHFRYVFGRLYGMSPSDYIIHCRVEEAKRQLLESRETITEIAFELGFSSSQYFSNTFKAKTGMRPIEYRKAIEEFRKGGYKVHGDQETSELMDKFF